MRLLELPARRARAAEAILAIGAPATAPLADALLDPRPEVAILAATVLGSLGEDAKGALPRLKELRDHEVAAVAHAAAWAAFRVAPTGATLYVDYSKAVVVELDGDGEERHRISDLRNPWDATKLHDGSYLVAEFGGNRVAEITSKGKVAWSFSDLKSPYDADRLATGNTLITDASNKRVIEVDRQGKIVWEYKVPGRPVDADRLPGGNTLISDFNGNEVIEVDPSGQVVWRLAEQPKVMDADRLPNGNTLVAVFGLNLVREVDRHGKVVRELKVEQPEDADALANGHVLVASKAAVLEFDAKGGEVWRRAGTFLAEINRY